MTEAQYIPERALVIVAHSDDIEFGIAGTVGVWTDAGAQVTYCIVTDSSAGSNEVDANPQELIEIRRAEQIKAAQIMGVTDVRFLGYADGTLQPSLELRRELTALVREVRPQAVITMDPTTVFAMDDRYINHPDHRAAGEAALYAVFPSAETRPIFPELLDQGCEPHKVDRLYLVLSGQPTVCMDVSTTHERKLAALRTHQSQVGEDAVEMVQKWDAENGEKISVAYAETFRLIRLNEDE